MLLQWMPIARVHMCNLGLIPMLYLPLIVMISPARSVEALA